jgi:hypothetical protein
MRTVRAYQSSLTPSSGFQSPVHPDVSVTRAGDRRRHSTNHKKKHKLYHFIKPPVGVIPAAFPPTSELKYTKKQ